MTDHRSSRARTSIVVAGLLIAGVGSAHGQSRDVDRRLGAEAAAEVEQTLGIVRHPEATAYVQALGARLVAGLEQRHFEYSFRLVNMTEPNAFALPGGHIFISPALLAQAQSEDELAGVIGHEIIHCHERHSIKRMRHSVLPGLLSVPGAVVGSVVDEKLGQMINAPLSTLTQLTMARYGRGHEKQSDRDGIELAAQAGYEPDAMAALLERVFRSFEVISGVPPRFSYFDSHPFTPDRAREVRKRAAKLSPAATGPLASGPEEMLARLEGLPLGPDPAQGVFKENVFLHPELGFAIDLPPGWEPVNTASVFGGYEPEKEAQLFLSLADGEPGELMASFVMSLRLQHQTEPASAGEVTVEGRTAHMVTLEERERNRVVTLYVIWLKLGELTFQAFAAGPEAHREPMETSLLSLRPLSEEERRSVTGIYLRGVTARAGDTLKSLAEREGNAARLDVVAVVNGVDEDATLAEGQLIRIGKREPYRPAR